MKRRRYVTILALAFVNLLWAAQYPAYRIASARFSAAALNFWVLVSAIVLLAPFLVRERRAKVRRGRREPQPDRRRTFAQFAVLGVFGILPPSILLSWGIARSTASNAAILSLTIPVLMTMLGVVMLGERLTRLRLASLAMALAGTLVISAQDLSGDLLEPRLLAGNAVILLAGLGSAFYNAYGKVLLARFSELEVLLGGYCVAAACCMLVSMASDREPFYHIGGLPAAVWISLAVLGGLTWGLAMVLWMWLLKRLEAGQASISIYLLSLFGVLLSAITLRERIGLAQMLGGALVVVATYLTSEYENRKTSYDAS